MLGNPVGFNLNEYEIIRSNLAMADNAIVFAKLIALSLLISATFVALLYFTCQGLLTKIRSDWFLIIPAIAILSTTFASIKVFSINPSSFPAPVKLFSVSAYYELKYSNRSKYSRKFDNSITAGPALAHNIIFIVDESIAATHLTINGSEYNTTPFLSSYLDNKDIYNFGVVSGVAPHSKLSNVVFRVGLQPKHAENFEEMYYTLPTLFQYARHAGYKTALLDMQMSDGALQNGLSTGDLKYIDNYTTSDRATDVAIRDIGALDVVSETLRQGGKNFIAIVKWGAHWPYQQSYPKQHQYFKPALDTVLPSLVSNDRESLLNTYRNAVRYATDFYLEKLVALVDLKTTHIIYTSDHGQDLSPDSKRMHGSDTDVTNAVVDIPLIIFQDNAKSAFKGIAANSQSAFQIFPTMLSWMGYGGDVVSRYGKTLNVPADLDLRRFFLNSEGKLQSYAKSPP